ncbi:EC1118_1B15_4093p [Saccharomyces cerevisiae EC1118]|uniref:EC1118_1B15_4093p n=1 Tax=Saccharomyces cerevisiae (strain Lalvin EC1118 / Prise de mousse) TaxID=643680 RepID=D3UEX9_YEAS8|nr:EC1118_1B15_4093p [Saccharomyces cerevisiae EC1118]
MFILAEVSDFILDIVAPLCPTISEACLTKHSIRKCTSEGTLSGESWSLSKWLSASFRATRLISASSCSSLVSSPFFLLSVLGETSTVVGVVVIDGFVVSVDIIELKSITERLFNAALDD